MRDATTCDGEIEVELNGPFAVDARAPGAIPELTDIETTALTYCRFELRWSPYEGPATDVPTELVGASFLIEGTRSDGARFVLRTDRNDELRLDARGAGFELDEATGALFVGFAAGQLFDGVMLDLAVAGADGVVRIEDGSNDDILDVFEANLEAAARLFDDDDDDGELDPDEREETEVLAD